MDTTHRELRKHDPQVADHLAQARSAANLRTRHMNEREEEARVNRLRRATHRRLRDEEREAATWFRGRVRVRVDDSDRPRVGVRTPRKLHSRDDPDHISGTIGKPVFTGPDGAQSVHFQFLARGLAGSKGKPWMPGEAARKLQYIVRYEALEDGAAGYWSNIAEDRAELAAFGNVLEALERHDRKNANVFCEEIIALPCELTAAQRRECVQHISHAISAKGLPFAVGIHKPDPKGDQRNFHCHLVYSLRPASRLGEFDWEFEPQKVSDINTPDGIRARRKAITTTLNVALSKAAIAKRYTDKSHAARGIKTPPGRKRGQALTAIDRKRQAEEKAAAKASAVAAAIERKFVTAREVAKLANDAAASLEEATAKLEERSAALRVCVLQMRDAVQNATTEAIGSADPARTAIDQMRHQAIAQTTSARGKLEERRAYIDRHKKLVRSAVSKAKIDFSQIDHPDHLETEMRLSQLEALKSQTPGPAITEQRNIAVDPSDPAPMSRPNAITVSASMKTPEGHVSIVDIRSLDNEVAEPPAPAPGEDIGRATLPTIEQGSSDDSASAVGKGEVGDGEYESDATTSLEADGGTNSILAPLQGPCRELTPTTPAPKPTAPQPKVAASHKPQEIEGYVPVFSMADLQAEEAADAERKAEAQARRDAEERANTEAKERARLAAEAKVRAEAEAHARRETEAARAKAKRLSEEKAAAARAAEAEAKRQGGEEQAPREAEAQRQAAAAAAARVVNPAPPVKRPATTPSKPVTAPPLPQLSRPTALEPVRNTAGNTPTPDGEALASTRTARPEAQMKPDAIRVQDDLVQKLDPALSGSPSPQPVQPEQPVPVQPAQQSQTFDEMSREQLDSTCNELVAKEMQIRADAAGIPIAQFKVFSLADQIQLGGGAGLPPEEAQRLAAIKERLRKLPMVAPPASVSKPARPTVPLPTPVQPAPNPPSKDEFEGMTAKQFNDLRNGGFGRG